MFNYMRLLLPFPSFPQPLNLQYTGKGRQSTPGRPGTLTACSPFQTPCTAAFTKQPLWYKTMAATEYLLPFSDTVFHRLLGHVPYKDSNPWFVIPLYPIPCHHSHNLQHSQQCFFYTVTWTILCPQVQNSLSLPTYHTTTLRAGVKNLCLQGTWR